MGWEWAVPGGVGRRQVEAEAPRVESTSDVRRPAVDAGVETLGAEKHPRPFHVVHVHLFTQLS